MNKSRSQKPKKRHHYVPACYLRLFSSDQTRNGALHVIDLDAGTCRVGTPESEAFEKHYNTVQGCNPPDAFENAFMEFEKITSPSWHKMISARHIPSDPDDHNNIMNFIAVLTLRTPPNRRSQHEFTSRLHTQVAHKLLSTAELFTASIERARAGGVEMPSLPDGVSLEDARQSLLKNGFEIHVTIPNNSYIDRMTQLTWALLPHLRKRWWVVHTLKDDSPKLLTSDDPVTVAAISNSKESLPVGFGSPNSVVVIPLTPKMILLGFTAARNFAPPSDSKLAEELNRITYEHSFRYLYSHSEESTPFFPFRNPSKGMSSYNELPPRLTHLPSTQQKFTTSMGDLLILQSSSKTSILDPSLF